MGKKELQGLYICSICNDNGDPVEASTNKYDKGNEEEMLNDVLHKIEWQIQSATTVLLQDLEIYFNYIEIPTGGAYTTSTAREDILNKSSVVKVVNNDDNCFWYALTNLIFSNHARVKEIRRGRKIRTDLSKELCEKCGFEWNKQISLADIPTIENILKINISVLDIENLPVLNTTTNIYNSLMYKNTTKIFNTRYWLLFDNDHYHSITNIKGFMAAKYFCHTCCHCFEKENSFKKHDCADCEMGQNYSKKKKKQVRNSAKNKKLSHERWRAGVPRNNETNSSSNGKSGW